MPWIGDFLVALAQWLKTTPLPGFSLWLSNTPLCEAIDSHFWVIPTIQTIHILTVAMTFSAVGMINLRILHAAGRSRTLAQTVHRFQPWIWGGLVVLLVTGVVLCIGEPTRELINPCFWTKMVLVAFAALLSLWFQGSVSRHAEIWEPTPGGRAVVRTGSVAVIALWCLIMLLGRWIAYAPA